MTNAALLPDLISRSIACRPDSVGLTCGRRPMSYDAVRQSLPGLVGDLVGRRLQRGMIDIQEAH